MIYHRQFSKFHMRRRRVLGINSVILFWWMTLHTITAFSMPARPRSLRRRRSIQILSSTLPVEGQTADVWVNHDDYMYDLYTSVALLDPTWFQEYIVNMVGKQDEIVNDSFFQHVETIKMPLKKSPRPRNRSPPMDSQFSPFLSGLKEEEKEFELSTSLFNITTMQHPPPPEISDETEQSQPEISSVEEILKEEVTISVDDSIPLSSILLDDIADTVDATLNLTLPVDVAFGTVVEGQELIDQSEIVRLNDVPSSSLPEKVAASDKSLTVSRVVVYWTDQEECKSVNLTFVLQLGYTELEIVALQSTALHCIVRDRIPKPRTGVPSRWKATESGMVEIVEQALVPDILRQNGSSSGPSKRESKAKLPEPAPVDGALPSARDRVESHDNNSVPPDIGLPFDSIPNGVHSTGIDDAEKPSSRDKRRMENGSPSEAKRPESTERRRRSRETPEKERPIYSGRPAAVTRRLENRPPPPKSGVWPNIDTFRKLLRDEASLRLRILGSDWSNAVKDEMDWRNDLYTSWLWTLHHGIGEPFVQSRSDRARRQTRDRR
jgi:hypothetical protein